MLKGIFYNPIHKNNEIVIKDSYGLIPMALLEFGGCITIMLIMTIYVFIISYVLYSLYS